MALARAEAEQMLQELATPEELQGLLFDSAKDNDADTIEGLHEA